MVAKSVIVVNNLTKSFKYKTNKTLLGKILKPIYTSKIAVDDVSFVVKQGECVGFLGPNGAGKSTTTKMMTGLVHPTSGKIEVLGYQPFEKKAKFLKQIGLIMGNKASLNWDMTARSSYELLIVIYDLDHKKAWQKITDLGQKLNVTDKFDTQVRSLSLGERMKLELLAAIVHSPKVLFLDEPTIGLDIQSKEELRNFIIELKKHGVTVILTSHDMDDIKDTCDRVIVINHGKLITDTSMYDLNMKYKNKKYYKLVIEDSLDKSIITSIGKVVSEHPEFIIETSTHSKLQLSRLLAEDKISDVSVEAIPLEQIIKDIYNK